jgi:hypothetical protein
VVVQAAILCYSVGPTITIHGRITAREYVDRLGNQVHPMMLQDHKGKLQHLPWPAQSPDLNITEPLWSVLETSVRNRFPPPTSLKQLEDVIQEIVKHSSRDCSKLV